MKKYYLFEMNLFWLQALSIILLVLMFILTGFIYDGVMLDSFVLKLVFILIIPYLILHELLHSLAYVLNGASFKNITYGIHLEKGVMCCLCKQNISKKIF